MVEAGPYDSSTVNVRRLGSDSDHLGGLVVQQFASERLVGKDLANLRGKKILLLTSYINEGQPWISESDFVFWIPECGCHYYFERSIKERLTFQEIFFDGHRTPSEFLAWEFVLRGCLVADCLHGLLVAKM